MQTATETLVTIASLELASSGSARFTKFLTPFVTDVLQARCRQEGFPPGTANHAEIVYNRMATHATSSFDPGTERWIWTNTISINRLRDLCNGMSKDTIRKALALLEAAGVIRAVSQDVLTDLARRHHALAYEVDHDGLASAHESLKARSEIRRWESSPRVAETVARESVPARIEPSGNHDRVPGNGCRHPDSQTSGIQKDHHDSMEIGNDRAVGIQADDADSLSAFLTENPECRDVRVVPGDAGLIGRVFDGTVTRDEPLTLSALPGPLTRHPWTWKAIASLMLELKASPKLTRPGGWLVSQLGSSAALERHTSRPLTGRARTVVTVVRSEPKPKEPTEAEITDELRQEVLRRAANSRPDLDVDRLARELLADDWMIRQRGWDSPLSSRLLGFAVYEIARQVTASMDLPACGRMSERVESLFAGV